MLPNTKALLVFAGRFLVVLFLMLPVWFALTPAYNRLLAFGANIVLPLAEAPRVHTLVGWKRDILIVRSDAPLTADMKIQGFTGYLTHFNLMLMLALVMAPRQVAWRNRCKILVTALPLLFLIHIGYLVIGVQFFQQPELEALRDPTGQVYVWGVNFYLSIVGQLAPVLLWIALSWAFGGIPDEARVVFERRMPGPGDKKRAGGRKGDRPS